MKNFISAVSAILIFAVSCNSVFACGPFTVEPVFSLQKHADYPLEEFVGGKTGVVPETYGQMSLFVFYRELNNSPLTADEQAQVRDVMKFRIGDYWTNGDNQDADQTNGDNSEPVPDYFQRWKTARAKVLNVDVKIPVDKQNPDSYSYYGNCLADAFNTAAATLDARITQYGAGDDVKEWLKGQDEVFGNCGANGAIPQDVASNAPQWLKNDRQYQIAAALFYDGKLPEARTVFEKIAADKNSAWSKTANFVVARTYIREASFIDDESPDYAPTPKPTFDSNANRSTFGNSNSANKVDISPTPQITKTVEEKKREKSALLDQATARLRNILTDASMSDFQMSARRLFGLVRFRNNPTERELELADALTAEKSNPNIKNDLIDYVWLLDKIHQEAYDTGFQIDQEEAKKQGREDYFDYQFKVRDVPAAKRTKDLTDWMLTYQAIDGFPHAYEQWKATGKPQWLVAALAKAGKNSAQNSELIAAADKISRNSPAYASAAYHQIRLLLETNNRAAAKRKLDQVFADSLKEFPVSAQNKFLSERMAVAANLDEFLKYAQRKPALFVWSDDGNEVGDPLGKGSDKYLIDWKNRVMFDDDAVAFFNEKMPLSVLRQAALSPQLPDYLKKFLVVAAWTRAVVLGNQAVEREFAPIVMRYAPEYNEYLSKYQSASGANREAAALIAVLRYPVVQPYVPIGLGREGATPTSIDSTRGNWWCAEDENKLNGEYRESMHYDEYNFKYPAAYPDFLTSMQTAEAAREHRQLLDAGNAATYLASRAVDFANRNLQNPNTPELLHLGVRATRYGCTDARTTPLSKQAFDILHQRFPRSEWTKKTPYWF